MSIGWGIGLMVASKISTKQEWINKKVGKAIMIGGAALAIGGAVEKIMAETAADGVLKESAGNSLRESVSGIGDSGSMVEGVSLDPTIAQNMTLAPKGEISMAATQNLQMPATVVDSSSGLLGSNGNFLDPSIVDPGPVVRGGGGVADKASPYALPASMVAGQALSGYAQARSEEKIAEDRQKREDEIRARQVRWGQSTDGKRQIALNMGSRLNNVNDKFFSSTARNGRDGGLLS